MCAAFIAQQQGIALDTALKKVPDSINDVWLVVAEFAVEAWGQDVDERFDGLARRYRGPVM
jgi:hypothetical protein